MIAVDIFYDMNKRLEKILEGIGLNNKEATVYLACLELDFASNAQIARATKLNRITNYEILKKLVEKKIVASYKKRDTKYFIAVDPRVIIKQAKDKILLAEDSLPEILSVANQIGRKPKIYYFEGIDGIKNIYDDSLTAKGTIFTFTNPKDVEDLLGKDYVEDYLQNRVKKGIKVKGLAPDNKYGKNAKEVSSYLLREARLFSDEIYKITNEIMIYDDKVAIYSGSDQIGLIIMNPMLASTFRNIWQMAWDK